MNFSVKLLKLTCGKKKSFKEMFNQVYKKYKYFYHDKYNFNTSFKFGKNKNLEQETLKYYMQITSTDWNNVNIVGRQNKNVKRKAKKHAKKGMLAEQKTTEFFKVNGYEMLPSKLPCNHGFDGCFIKYSENYIPSDIHIVETKFSKNGLYTKGMTHMGEQTSQEWIWGVLVKMLNAEYSVKATAILILNCVNKNIVKVGLSLLSSNCCVKYKLLYALSIPEADSSYREIICNNLSLLNKKIMYGRIITHKQLVDLNDLIKIFDKPNESIQKNVLALISTATFYIFYFPQHIINVILNASGVRKISNIISTVNRESKLCAYILGMQFYFGLSFDECKKINLHSDDLGSHLRVRKGKNNKLFFMPITMQRRKFINFVKHNFKKHHVLFLYAFNKNVCKEYKQLIYKQGIYNRFLQQYTNNCVNEFSQGVEKTNLEQLTTKLLNSKYPRYANVLNLQILFNLTINEVATITYSQEGGNYCFFILKDNEKYILGSFTNEQRKLLFDITKQVKPGRYMKSNHISFARFKARYYQTLQNHGIYDLEKFVIDMQANSKISTNISLKENSNDKDTQKKMKFIDENKINALQLTTVKQLINNLIAKDKRYGCILGLQFLFGLSFNDCQAIKPHEDDLGECLFVNNQYFRIRLAQQRNVLNIIESLVSPGYAIRPTSIPIDLFENKYLSMIKEQGIKDPYHYITEQTENIQACVDNIVPVNRAATVNLDEVVAKLKMQYPRYGWLLELQLLFGLTIDEGMKIQPDYISKGSLFIGDGKQKKYYWLKIKHSKKLQN